MTAAIIKGSAMICNIGKRAVRSSDDESAVDEIGFEADEPDVVSFWISDRFMLHPLE
jgi:hypothetical protein